MELEDRIVSLFHNSMEINAITIEQYTPLIAHAGELLLHCLVNESKILCCANGASSPLGQHFTSLLMNRFRHERPGLPAINLNSDGSTLSAICEDTSFMDAHAKQIHALGQPGDILLLLTPHGRSSNLVQAIQAAHDREMTVIVLNGGDGGDITALLSPEEVEICVPSEDSALVHHAQLLVLHALCDLIDYQLFGSDE
ncbi:MULTISPECIES: SIS domain-containing protein [unclassified Neptuniibacter]|jgi:D-sedoheptulose 7-phosphate isomerase|uniref:SIS domain-containing protein n=1 Tax=unclassified Neptuniibacter TaxID=2630693 RepID=UPI000C3B05BE|nr:MULTISPECIES: SIS domain-containing protein [unclassified Neptuniibacter]MAY43390.1 phosphoheptose isomerase [Oceanospirillaceae bacterium]|tara:strand:- start:20051 stop:20644 length:594 start_codon:yes stop_codon:yes gene_type:complete